MRGYSYYSAQIKNSLKLAISFLIVICIILSGFQDDVFADETDAVTEDVTEDVNVPEEDSPVEDLTVIDPVEVTTSETISQMPMLTSTPPDDDTTPAEDDTTPAEDGSTPAEDGDSQAEDSTETDTIPDGWDEDHTHYYIDGIAQTGFVKIDDASYFFNKDGVFSEITGLIQNPTDGKWYYVEKGILSSGSGVVKCIQKDSDRYKKWYYVHKGVFNGNATGMVKCIQPDSDNKGQWLYVYKGQLNKNATGLVKCIQPNDSKKGEWFYVYKGKLNKNATGLVKCIQPNSDSKNNWYYVYKGKLNKNATGIVKCVQPNSKNKNNWFFVKEGKLTKVSGLAKCIQPGSKNKGTWYYVSNGKKSDTATGYVKRIQSDDKSDNPWSYVHDGKAIDNVTGMVKCIQPDSSLKNKWIYIANGKRKKATGVVKCVQHDSKKYEKMFYVKKGELEKATGLFPAVSPTSDYAYYYYIKDGKHNLYTGSMSVGGTYYYLQDGIAPKWMYGPGSRGSHRHVIVSIGRQHLWYYHYGRLKVSTPVVTGMDGVYNTPKGTLAAYSKGRNVRLIGPTWDTRVDYWMSIVRSGAYGLHSSYRTAFGGQIYKTNGSHGCINTPISAVQIIYNSVSIGTPIYVTS